MTFIPNVNEGWHEPKILLTSVHHFNVIRACRDARKKSIELRVNCEAIGKA